MPDSAYQRWVLRRLLAQTGGRCVYCGRAVRIKASPTAPDRATVDHIVPRSMGGGGRRDDNLAPACRSCNVAKGAMPADVFLAERARAR